MREEYMKTIQRLRKWCRRTCSRCRKERRRLRNRWPGCKRWWRTANRRTGNRTASRRWHDPPCSWCRSPTTGTNQCQDRSPRKKNKTIHSSNSNCKVIIWREKNKQEVQGLVGSLIKFEISLTRLKSCLKGLKSCLEDLKLPKNKLKNRTW